MTSPEQGRVEVLRLQPSDNDAVKDARVFLDPLSIKAIEQKPSTPVANIPAPPPPGPTTELTRALTNSDIVSLAQAGLGDAVIVSKIRSSGLGYSLEPEGLVDLKKNGVSDAVISAMLEASK